MKNPNLEIPYQEFDFRFETESTLEGIRGEAQVFDVTMRLGNAPIVKNLYKLFQLKEEQMPPDMKVLYEQKDLYSVVHAISTISKNAYIESLRYDAEILDSEGAQTLDLIPNTKFKEWLSGNMGVEVALSASGNLSAALPEELSKITSWADADLGAGIKLKTDVGGGLAGKFSFSIGWPVVQSMGVASTKCAWLLNPETGKPLNGDQLLVQIIAVPKDSKKLKYRISGEITADKGIFWRSQTQKTKPIEVEILL